MSPALTADAPQVGTDVVTRGEPPQRGARLRQRIRRGEHAARQWQERGSCRTSDPGLFFGPENESDSRRKRRVAAAKAVCLGCPVLGLCRAYAVENGERYGVWGGMSEYERMPEAARIRSYQRRAASEHTSVLQMQTAMPHHALDR
jgi:WhiB family redox-sensing transcriptional regulator